MTKQEAIDILNGLAERLNHVPDSYDSETDVRAIEIAVDCIEQSIKLDELFESYGVKGE